LNFKISSTIDLLVVHQNIFSEFWPGQSSFKPVNPSWLPPASAEQCANLIPLLIILDDSALF